MYRLSVAVFVFVVLASGSLFATPSITSLSLTSGQVNTPVTITGTGFGTGGYVSIQGTAAITTSWSSTSIVALVPPNMSAGSKSVYVFSNGNGSSNTVTFTVTAPPNR
jgi:hypothetical protein